MSFDLKHLPNLTDLRYKYLRVAQMLGSQDMAIFVLTTMIQPITLPPCACTQDNYDSPCYYQLSKGLAVCDFYLISASGLMPLW